MAFSISPASASPQQEVSPSSYLDQMLEGFQGEKEIDKAKREWLAQLNEIPVNQREAYGAGIDRVVQELYKKCHSLCHEGYKAHEIIAELNKTIRLYNTSYALFAENTNTYNEQRLIEEAAHASLGEQFRRGGRSFTIYQLPEYTPKDPYEAQAQFEALVVLGGVHTVATALQLTGATLAEGAKIACKLTKTTETACKATLDFGKKVVDAIPIDIKATIQDVQASGEESLTKVLRERYKFPGEHAKQLAHQNMDDLLVVSTAGVTGIASSLAIKAGKHCISKLAPSSKRAAGATASEGASSATATAATQKPFNAYLGMNTNFLTEGTITSAEKFTNSSFGSSSNFVLNKWPLLETQLPSGLGTQSSALGVRSALAAEAAREQFPLNLGNPNAIDTTFERLKKSIESSERRSTMEATIDNEVKLLNILVPTLSSEGKKILELARFIEMPESTGNYSTTLIDAGNRFIRKDFKDFHSSVSTFVGLNFLRSLNLQHTAVAEPIAFWQSGGQASLIKTFLDGQPIREWIDIAAKLSPGSKERFVSVEQLEKMVFTAGRSVGELQAKGALLPPLPESQLSSLARRVICKIEDFISDTRLQLSYIGKQFKTDPEKLLGPTFKKFENNPGPVSYGFGNIRSSEFLWNPEKAQLACLNTKGMTWTIDSKGVPRQFISEEHTFFRRLLIADGFEAGLEFAEIKNLLNAFDMGYHVEYRGPAPTLVTAQLYDLYGSFQTLNISSAKLQKTADPRLHRFVDSHIKHIDQQLRAYSQPEATASFQNPNDLF